MSTKINWCDATWNPVTVIAAMRARGFEPEDDNDADALALLFAYLEKEESE